MQLHAAASFKPNFDELLLRLVIHVKTFLIFHMEHSYMGPIRSYLIAKSPLFLHTFVHSASVFGLRPDFFPARYSVSA
jgi:transposase